MGSLDDAIREHLELKRRLGASDEEIEKKESEAFGKGNRPVQPDPEATVEPPADGAVEPEPELEPDSLAAAEPAANGRSAEPGPETQEWEQPVEPAGALDQELFEPDEVPLEESLDPLTVRDQRGAVEPLPQEPAEDVLEETPEFLEETPEHDRLWFEQGPPKDFDLD